ncbi:Verru_Chthon cassette protein C [Verrucomicrobium sp. GAS474]|uniref:Verru_Chthon cassette protein C n=1 Tax=Verrucomicrobium sp. GAS474 TaxID=1882831 RepID=UPI00087BD35A|nr:Verru_Chthon cassette protein C [Verrucomicrobium sp. GAS474]SDU29356.1 Verru_Chthon cassette protein C [Verrucomicrobium sp. GAS474]
MSSRPTSPTTVRDPLTARARARGSRAFSLVEILVASVVLLIIMAMLTILVGQTGKVWKKTTAKIEAFQNARAAYQTMTARLSGATLNTYLDYYDASYARRTPANSATFAPVYYARASDLHFVADRGSVLLPDGDGSAHPGSAVFFQAPLGYASSSAYAGMPNALNACGYYVAFEAEQTLPSFLQNLTKVRYRYRLLEFLQPTDSFALYTTPSSGSNPSAYEAWFRSFLPPAVSRTKAPLRVLAENIVALVVLPQLSPLDSGTELSPAYSYDSRAGNIQTATYNQLPPLLRVVMIALDEPSAQRLSPDGESTQPGVVTAALNGRFQSSSQLNADIASVTRAFDENHLSYRVFDSVIAIRGAKWSQ